MANYKPHSEATKLKIAMTMVGNKNAEKEELSLPAAIKIMEHMIELTQKSEDYYFISQIAKELGTDRFKIHRLIHTKYPDELQELSEQLYNNLESNLFIAAATKKIDGKMATLALRNFFEKDWNKATNKTEVENHNKTTIVWEENLLIPQGKQIQYIDITPNTIKLPEHQEDTTKFDDI